VSAQHQVRAATVGYAGLYLVPLSAGRGRFHTSNVIAEDDTPTRFSIRDEDGSKLIDFELENWN
jgi:hypothetical protein